MDYCEHKCKELLILIRIKKAFKTTHQEYFIFSFLIQLVFYSLFLKSLFHFSDSAAFSQTAELQLTTQEAFFDGSPYNIIPIYLPLVRFNSMIVALLQEE